MQLSNKTVLLTGGNSGIGLALAEQLIQLGSCVVVVSRSQNHWHELKQLDNSVITLQCDLSNLQQLLSLHQQLQSEQITVDYLINCAAVQYTPKFTDPEFRFETIAQEITINFTAICWLSSLLLPQLLQRPQAAIINISSGLAIYPKTNSAIYCSSKAALHNFSQSLRYQLEDTQTRVIEVLMPLVDTPMTSGRGSGKISADEAAKGIIKAIQEGKDEYYVGKARILPLLSRLWPSLIKKILKQY